jgi:hypothetical protein
MECPKCGGGSFLSDEELVKVLEGSDPLTVLLKLIYSCRACGEKFSRLFFDDLNNRKKPTEMAAYPQPPQAQQYQSQSQDAAPPNPYQYQKEKTEEEAAEGLKFF